MARRGTLRDRSGSVAIEWTLVAGTFAILLISVVELGTYFYAAQSLRTLVGDVARQAIVNTNLGRTGQDCTTPRANWGAKTPMINNNGLTLCVTRTAQPNNLVRIDVTGSYPFSFSSPLLRAMSFPAISETTRYTVAGN